MRKLLDEFGVGKPQSSQTLTEKMSVHAQHVAPAGHDRDRDVTVVFHLTPWREPVTEVEPASKWYVLYNEATAGLCNVLFKHGITGFKINSIEFDQASIDWILPISCRHAGQLAAEEVLKRLKLGS
jgi:hypothetical protein